MSSPQITRMFGRSTSDMRLLCVNGSPDISAGPAGSASPGRMTRRPRAPDHLDRTIRPPCRVLDALRMSRERCMALCFALGSLCFLIGPFPGYVELVGPGADAVTFFAGSLLFTAGGALQLWLSLKGPRSGVWAA